MQLPNQIAWLWQGDVGSRTVCHSRARQAFRAKHCAATRQLSRRCRPAGQRAWVRGAVGRRGGVRGEVALHARVRRHVRLHPLHARVAPEEHRAARQQLPQLADHHRAPAGGDKHGQPARGRPPLLDARALMGCMMPCTPIMHARVPRTGAAGLHSLPAGAAHACVRWAGPKEGEPCVLEGMPHSSKERRS